MYCPKCGAENSDDVKFCASCGSSMGSDSKGLAQSSATPKNLEASIESHDDPQGAHVTTVNVQVPNQIQKNGIGTAGFILALIGIFTSWIPVMGWIVWVLGAILSLVGLFKKPKGFAIAGVVLSFIDVIILLFIVAGCSAAGGLLSTMM